MAPFHRGFDAQYGLDPEGHVALGLSSDTSVVEPGSSGTLHATARAMAGSDDTWVWTVDIRSGTAASPSGASSRRSVGRDGR
jgi:hypothetical protein